MVHLDVESLLCGEWAPKCQLTSHQNPWSVGPFLTSFKLLIFFLNFRRQLQRFKVTKIPTRDWNSGCFYLRDVGDVGDIATGTSAHFFEASYISHWRICSDNSPRRRHPVAVNLIGQLKSSPFASFWQRLLDTRALNI